MKNINSKARKLVEKLLAESRSIKKFEDVVTVEDTSGESGSEGHIKGADIGKDAHGQDVVIVDKGELEDMIGYNSSQLSKEEIELEGCTDYVAGYIDGDSEDDLSVWPYDESGVVVYTDDNNDYEEHEDAEELAKSLPTTPT